jgi:uncharacterized membrane protein YbhN (UPF0104 family)
MVELTGVPVSRKETSISSPKRTKAFWWGSLTILFSGAVLYWAVRGVDWARFAAIVAGARWEYLLLSAAVTGSSFLLRAVRWRILLNAEGAFDVATVFWANMAGYLGNNFLPARGGELIRTVLISRRSALSKSFVLTTALSERLMDVIAVILWAAAAMRGVEPKPKWLADASGVMLAGALAVCLLTALLPLLAGPLERTIQRLPAPAAVTAFALRHTEQALAGLRCFHDARRLAGFAFLTAAIWMIEAAALMVAAHALGLTLAFRVAILLVAGLALGSSLPSTPGYVGIFQAVAVTILPPFGFTRDQALAFICVAQAASYTVVLVLGLPGMWILRRGLPAGETKLQAI